MQVIKDMVRCKNKNLLRMETLEYYSRSYIGTQKNYSTTEKELLAVVMAVEKFLDQII